MKEESRFPELRDSVLVLMMVLDIDFHAGMLFASTIPGKAVLQ